jgi:hypothetical protein
LYIAVVKEQIDQHIRDNLYFLMGWDWFHLVLRPLFGLLYQPQMIHVYDDDCGTIGGMRIGRGNPAPVSLWPSQIPHELIRARTRAAAVGSRRLTAWAVARPWNNLRFNTNEITYVYAMEKWARAT